MLKHLIEGVHRYLIKNVLLLPLAVLDVNESQKWLQSDLQLLLWQDVLVVVVEFDDIAKSLFNGISNSGFNSREKLEHLIDDHVAILNDLREFRFESFVFFDVIRDIRRYQELSECIDYRFDQGAPSLDLEVIVVTEDLVLDVLVVNVCVYRVLSLGSRGSVHVWVYLIIWVSILVY